jgi:hypothetical protein
MSRAPPRDFDEIDCLLCIGMLEKLEEGEALRVSMYLSTHISALIIHQADPSCTITLFLGLRIFTRPAVKEPNPAYIMSDIEFSRACPWQGSADTCSWI